MNKPSCLYFSAILFLSAAAAADEPSAAVQSPLSIEEALRTFRIAEGLQIELAAAEPEVVDPVAIRFDEYGRMWVVEMRDYPNGPAAGKPPMSRIKRLEDLDGDGRYETARVFADELLFATGIQPWREGLIVTYSGRIDWFRDEDDDGRADHRETWFTGFAEENSQLRANHPRFALDNRVYVANGLRGGAVKNAKQPDAAAISISGRDFRFDPRTLAAAAVSGNGQFGLTFDDYGNRFTCSNRNPLIHVVLADDDLARNPYLAVPAVVNDVAAAGDASRVFPISQAWTTSNLHAGQFTAACGVEIYRGDALPAEFQGNAFTCEPTGNLVHCERLEPVGATFVSKPVVSGISRSQNRDEGVEFLASPDTWFRPVNLETGPDGALYVVDMYRAVIEHPDWVPEELKHRPDERYGDDRGRIYRVVPVGWQRRAVPRLGDASTADLAAMLGHANSWRRETAARLIFERQDRSVVPVLRELARGANAGRTRVHALWALAGLDALDHDTIIAALHDDEPRVREQAVMLAPRLGGGEAKDLLRRVIELAVDGDPRVRFRVALALGQVPEFGTVETLAKIALRSADDVWTRRAVETAVSDRAGRLLELVVAEKGLNESTAAPSPEGRRALAGELAQLVGARHDKAEVVAAIDLLAGIRSHFMIMKSQIHHDARKPTAARKQLGRMELTILLSMAQGAQSRGTSLASVLPDEPKRLQSLRQHFKLAGELAADTDVEYTLRAEACAALQYADDDLAVPVLLALLERDESRELSLRVVRALAAHASEKVGGALLQALPRSTPQVRGAVFDALLARPERAGALLDAISAGAIKATELDPLRANRLLQHSDPALRTRAADLLAAAQPAERAQVLADYRAALDLASDVSRGREVFKKNCAICHRIGAVGVDVAPSISDSRIKTREQLLTDILLPSKAIDAAYVSFTVLTADGRTETGLIAAETASSVTLKQAEGKSVTLLRSEIEELRSNGISLMPEGLERNISQQEMADLISFIKNWRYLEANVPARAGP
jgi:putative membrane-bound dehydrogenase-like protein